MHGSEFKEGNNICTIYKKYINNILEIYKQYMHNIKIIYKKIHKQYINGEENRKQQAVSESKERKCKVLKQHQDLEAPWSCASSGGG